MALSNKTARFWSLYSVWSVCSLLLIQGTVANHAVKPLLFIDFYGGEGVSESTLNPSPEENGLESLSYEELQLINNSTTTVSKSNSTETSKLSASTKSHSEIEKDDFIQSVLFGTPTNDETGAGRFELPSPDKVEAGMSTEGVENPESCDYIPLQITRIYFKAIASLIQHIMDAIFSVNEPPMNSRLGEPLMFDDDHIDSSPSRKLRKRDISLESELKVSTIESELDTPSTTHSDLTTDKTPPQVLGKRQLSIPENVSLSETLISQTNQTESGSSKPSKETEHPGTKLGLESDINAKTEKDGITLKSVQGEIEKATSSSSTHNKNAPTSKKQSASRQKNILSEENKTDKMNSPYYMVLDHNKNEPLLYDQTSGGKQVFQEDRIYEFEPIEVQPKATGLSVSNKEGDGKNIQSSSTSYAFTITGTVLAVIVLAFVGAAAAYAFVWKKNGHQHHPQHAGSGSSNQRSAMA